MSPDSGDDPDQPPPGRYAPHFSFPAGFKRLCGVPRGPAERFRAAAALALVALKSRR